MTEPTYDLSIVIVTYKTKQLVKECLDSVLAELQAFGGRWQIVVVDNNSQDGTVEMIREEYPKVNLIANKDNRGPAGAYNQGVKAGLNSRYIMMLNSDIYVLEGTLHTLYSYLETHPEIDGAMGGLFNPDGSRQRLRVSIVSLRKKNWSEVFRATFISTCFSMIRSKVFEDVGLFDENYYFHNEDLDWSERAKRSGHVFYYLPEAKVIHHMSQGFKQNYGPIIQELYKSNLYYFRKFYGPVVAFLAMQGMKAEIAWRIKNLKQLMSQTEDPEELRRHQSSLDNLIKARAKMLKFAKEKQIADA